MDTIVGNYYLVNNELYKSAEINYNFNNSPYLVYEVIRCESGKMYFLNDHLDRMHFSIIPFGFERVYNKTLLKTALKKLYSANATMDGNIKIMCSSIKDNLQYAAFYIPHNYPALHLYETGVKLITYPIERNNPAIKQISVNQNVRAEIAKVKDSSNAFEVLLVNDKNEITEGSASNFFLVKDNTIYSAPEENILKGITRKYVLESCLTLTIKNETRHLFLSEIQKYDAAFICGTSPKVLPAAYINETKFNPRHPVIQKLMDAYDKILEKHS